MISRSPTTSYALIASICIGLLIHPVYAAKRVAPDPLPSWNAGPAKQAIFEFVKRLTDENSRDYQPPNQRIAVFDNDGTLWAEQPLYIQLQFAIDRVKALAPQHPEWKDQQPFKAVLENDFKALTASGEQGLQQLIAVTHSGMTTDEFAETVRQWLVTAKHPKFNRPYTELIYQPMLELLQYLRAKGFKTYIASGGGVEFIRVFSEAVYGIPPEQVIGSYIKTKFELREGLPVIVRLPEIDFIDDKAGKPVAINQFIGRRPIAAFGNSDGDLQMLQWTCAKPERSFCLIVHHDDAEREFAYDRNSSVGRLDAAWNEAEQKGWTVVNMSKDWKRVWR